MARRPGKRWLLACAMVCAGLTVGLLAPHLFSATELVRMRHAMVLGDDLAVAQAQWVAASVPAGFVIDRRAPNAAFLAIADQLGLRRLPDDDARAVAITSHLHLSAPKLLGGALHADLAGTYLGIVRDGRGYCGDFVRAFNAIALAAGLQVRNWAFSFDGYGGHGHIFVELWNRQRERWELLDVYNNFRFIGADGLPISALAFHQALGANQPLPLMQRIEPRALPGYEIEAKAWDYYRRGASQWYMPWGLNPFDVDAHPMVRLFSGWSRSLEQLTAIAVGLQPQVRMLAEANNAEARDAMRHLRLRLAWAAVCAFIALLCVLALWLMRRRGREPATGQARVTDSDWPVVGLVGPLPPPSGGMANQCEQLLRLLKQEGVAVHVIRTNAPYVPHWVGQVPLLRAGFRLLPYLWRLWRELGRCQVMHVMANSGLAWHLLAAPAIWIARLRHVPAIVNYRGGEADAFFSRAPRRVLELLGGAALRVTPSAFLLRVFAKHGLQAQVIPNIIDLSRFQFKTRRPTGDAPHLVVSRNLEPIYDNATALRAFAALRARFPRATLTIAGIGPERSMLGALAAELGVAAAVHFAGRIDNAQMADLYGRCDLMLNPSTVDNMPISILEALACGVPVVSTNAGGIPDLVEHGRHAWLVEVGDTAGMANAACRVLEDVELAANLTSAGRLLVEGFAWPRVREQWRQAYWRAVSGNIKSPSAVDAVAIR